MTEERGVGRRIAAFTAREYDFLLTVLTIALVALIGLLFVGGTVYSYFAARSDPAWTQTPMYDAYVESMNSCLFPLLVTLLVTLSLCIPRRLFTRRMLLVVSIGMLATMILIFALVDLRTAWLFLLAAAGLIQAVVVVLTAARSRQVHYLQEGFLIRMGSAILHLGFIVLIATFVANLDLSGQLKLFWTATALVMAGSAMSLYSGELRAFGRRVRGDTRSGTHD